MRMTVVALPPAVLEKLATEPTDFEFRAQGRSWLCTREVAAILAPVLTGIWETDPSVAFFEITEPIPLLFINIFFDQLTGRNAVISRGNSQHFLKLGNNLQNGELVRACTFVATDRENPEEFLDYVLDHCANGISVLYDATHMASRFERYFAQPKFTQLPPEVLQTMLKSNDMRHEYRRLASECLQESKKRYTTIDKYIVVSNPLTRREEIDIPYDETNELMGILAYMNYLMGKDALASRAIAIDTLYPYKEISKLVDLNNLSRTIRLVPVEGVNMLLYDFLERRISLTAFTIVSGDDLVERYDEGPKQWALLGSHDLMNWRPIYESRGEPEFREAYSKKTFKCRKTEYFRFIRYEQRSTYSTHKKRENVINLSAIEFYGHCTIV